jgi:hypothetical protein
MTEPLSTEEEKLLKDLRRRKAKQIRDKTRKIKFTPRNKPENQ